MEFEDRTNALYLSALVLWDRARKLEGREASFRILTRTFRRLQVVQPFELPGIPTMSNDIMLVRRPSLASHSR